MLPSERTAGVNTVAQACPRGTNIGSSIASADEDAFLSIAARGLCRVKLHKTEGRERRSCNASPRRGPFAHQRIESRVNMRMREPHQLGCRGLSVPSRPAAAARGAALRSATAMMRRGVRALRRRWAPAERPGRWRYLRRTRLTPTRDCARSASSAEHAPRLLAGRSLERAATR